MNGLLTDTSRDWIAIFGMALAVLQTVLAIWQLWGTGTNVAAAERPPATTLTAVRKLLWNQEASTAYRKMLRGLLLNALLTGLIALRIHPMISAGLLLAVLYASVSIQGNAFHDILHSSPYEFYDQGPPGKSGSIAKAVVLALGAVYITLMTALMFSSANGSWIQLFCLSQLIVPLVSLVLAPVLLLWNLI